MRRNKALPLLLGLRLRDPASEPALRAAEAALGEASSAPSGLPLSWNLPLGPFQDNRSAADLAAEIKSRGRSGADAVLLMGYSGAPHPLLAPEELDRELAWCRKNPWGPGARTLFGQDPLHLLPAAADLLRDERQGVYGRHGFASVGVLQPWKQAGSSPFPASRRPERPVLYPAYLAPAGAPPAEVVASVRRTWLGGPLFLLLELDEGPAPGLRRLLEALGRRFDPQLLTLEQALAGEALRAAPLPSLQPLSLLAPAVLEDAARAGALRSRARRRTEAEVRATLEALGSSASRPRAAARLRGTRRAAREEGEATLIAAMAGMVTLDGPGFAATFADGRLSGLQRQGRQLLCGQPAASYLVAGGRRRDLATESAFSFERDRDSGLRTLMRTDFAGGQVQLVTLASFHEGQEQLELRSSLTFPELPPATELEAVVPLELAVFCLAAGERARLTAELPGGTVFSASLGGREEGRLIYGSRVLLARETGGPSLAFSPGAPGGVVVLQVRAARAGRGWRLLASPFGARAPASGRLYSRRTLTFSLRLGLDG